MPTRSRILVTTLSLVLVLSLTCHTVEAAEQDARATISAAEEVIFKRQDYAAALRILYPLAKKGNGEAQCLIGNFYRYGQGVPKDYTQAIKWYKISVDGRYPQAFKCLGDMYTEGLGVPKDLKQAGELYRKAKELLLQLAEEGDPDAQVGVGTLYKEGKDFPHDSTLAFKWYRAAALQGHPFGQHQLGHFYEFGDVVQKNINEALKWYRLAADQGFVLSQWWLGILYQNGNKIPRNLPMALHWLLRAAGQGIFPVAQCLVAEMYETGRGHPIDYTKALMWYKINASIMDLCEEERDKLARRMTNKEIAEAERLAREWLKKHGYKPRTD